MHIKLCWRRVDGKLQHCVVVHSNVNMPHAILTILQCLHVVSVLRCQADAQPEFRYIMPLAIETYVWTDKLLRSIQRFTHIRTPEFRYIMPCFADVAKLVVLRVEGKLMRVF